MPFIRSVACHGARGTEYSLKTCPQLWRPRLAVRRTIDLEHQGQAVACAEAALCGAAAAVRAAASPAFALACRMRTTGFGPSISLTLRPLAKLLPGCVAAKRWRPAYPALIIFLPPFVCPALIIFLPPFVCPVESQNDRGIGMAMRSRREGASKATNNRQQPAKNRRAGGSRATRLRPVCEPFVNRIRYVCAQQRTVARG